MFRASSAHLQKDTVVYKQHMVPSLSMRVPGGLFCLWAHPSQRVMVEHKHVLLHIPIRKSHMVSCLVILGAKSVVPSLWVPCVQSIVEGMFHLETDELGLCQSGGAPSCWEMKSSESSFSCGNSQSCSTLRYQFPLRVYINYQLDALTIIYS